MKSFTGDPMAIGHYGPLTTEDGQQLEVTGLRRHAANDELIIRFGGVNSRTDAERLAGRGLYVARDVLPEPEEREYYYVDLIDLRADSRDGSEIGRVSAVHNFGAGDILEITRPDGSTELIPFTDEHVPVVDFADGRIVVEIPAAGPEES